MVFYNEWQHSGQGTQFGTTYHGTLTIVLKLIHNSDRQSLLLSTMFADNVIGHRQE